MSVQKSKTQLYRHYDAEDRLLYVGISLSTVSRLAQHKDSAKWFGALAKVTVQLFDTREAALEAEAHAIAVEDPIFNRRRPPPGLYGPKIAKDGELSLFNEDADCPKCGSNDLGLKWFPSAERRSLKNGFSPDPREHLRSECNSCGYEWSEATLDSVVGAEPETETKAA